MYWRELEDLETYFYRALERFLVEDCIINEGNLGFHTECVVELGNLSISTPKHDGERRAW